MKKTNLMKENHQPAAVVKCLLALLICCCMLFSTVDFPAFAGVSEDVASYSDGQESQDEGFIEEIYEEIYEEEEPAPAPRETGDEAEIVSVDTADDQAASADENQLAAASQESSQDESTGGQDDQSVSSAGGEAQNEGFSPAPFSQETAVDGVDFIIFAEQGVVVPGEGFSIKWVINDELESCANEALSLDFSDDNTIIYHNVFQLSGASLNGKAHVQMQRLGFEDWANQFPGASLGVFVLSYHPDEDSAADRITVLESVYSQDQVAFDITGLGEYDVAAVLFLSAPEEAAEPEPATVPDTSNEPDEFETEEAVEENQGAASAGDINNSDESELIEIIDDTADTGDSEDTSAVEIIDDTPDTSDSEDTSTVEIIDDTPDTSNSEDTSAVEIIDDTADTSDSEDTSAVEETNDTEESDNSQETSAIEETNDTLETGDSEDASAVEIIDDTPDTSNSEDTSAVEETNDTLETGDSEDASTVEETNDTLETGDSEDASTVEETNDTEESDDSEDASAIEVISDSEETGDSEDTSTLEEISDSVEISDSNDEATGAEEQIDILASEPENAAPFEIVKQPENAVGEIGDDIRFIVEAKGDGLSYQWQKRSGDDSPWTNIESSGNATFAGSLTPELSFTASKCTITKQYQCLISQGEGDDLETLTTQTVAVVSEEEAAADVPEEESPAQVSQDEPTEAETETEAENKNEADDPEAPVENGEEKPDGEPETAEAEPVKDEENQAAEESEPVTGEEEQPAEEIGEQEPVEEAPAPAELPENRKVNFVIEWDDEVPTIGSIAHFKATLENYDTLEYTLQWQYSDDGATWNDVEGATDKDMDVEVTMSNYQYFWRLSVCVIDVLED